MRGRPRECWNGVGQEVHWRPDMGVGIVMGCLSPSRRQPWSPRGALGLFMPQPPWLYGAGIRTGWGGHHLLGGRLFAVACPPMSSDAIDTWENKASVSSGWASNLPWAIDSLTCPAPTAQSGERQQPARRARNLALLIKASICSLVSRIQLRACSLSLMSVTCIWTRTERGWFSPGSPSPPLFP